MKTCISGRYRWELLTLSEMVFFRPLKGKRTYRFPFAAGFSAIVTDKRLRIPGATTSEGAETEFDPHLISGPMVEILELDRTDSQRKRFTATVVDVISMFLFKILLYNSVFHIVLNFFSRHEYILHG